MCRGHVRRIRPSFVNGFLALARQGRTAWDLAREFEPNPQTIQSWIRQAIIDQGLVVGVTSDEKEDLAGLRREVEILREKPADQPTTPRPSGPPLRSRIANTSIAFGSHCHLNGVVPSTGSVGDCYDNAMAESFFATLECELLDRHTFPTRTTAETALFKMDRRLAQPPPATLQPRTHITSRLRKEKMAHLTNRCPPNRNNTKSEARRRKSEGGQTLMAV